MEAPGGGAVTHRLAQALKFYLWSWNTCNEQALAFVRLSRGGRRQRDGFRGGNQRLKEDLEEGLSRSGNGDAKALGCRRSPCLGIGAEAALLFT